MSLNPKDNFNSRIINLESFLTGKPNKMVKKVVELLDSGNEDEKSTIRSIDEHWLVFLFECDGDVNGALLVSKDTRESKRGKLTDTITKYFERVIPSTTKSSEKCESILEASFPKIFESNVLCQLYKF